MAGSKYTLVIFLSYVSVRIIAFGICHVDDCARQSSHVMAIQQASPSSVIKSSFLLSALMDNEMKTSWSSKINELNFENDQVVRIMDANTIKMKKKGLVSLSAINTPSGYKDEFRFPQCMSKSPTSKIKQLLPRATEVLVKVTNEGSVRPRALVINRSSGQVVNFELVRAGFAKPVSKDRKAIDSILPGFYESLVRSQVQAENDGIGMFQRCDSLEVASEDQFEELDATVEIRYGVDGGTQVIKLKDENIDQIPLNPGDQRMVSLT